MKGRYTPVAAALAFLLAGCPAPAPQVDGDDVCELPTVSVELPADIQESSGVAASRQYPGVFWTHNDSGWDPVVFAVDSTGAILARVRVPDVTNRDWEDIELAPCNPGDDQHCLFIGEIGDNRERHPRIAVYRIPEPNPRTDSVSQSPTILRATYQDGPRDAEALFVTERGIFIVNKGRSHAIELFQIRPPYRHAQSVTLVALQEIAPPPTSVSAQVTAAAASNDGERVVLRTYGGIYFFALQGDTLVSDGRAATLVAPDQRQGEGIDFLGKDRFVLTSESQGPHPASLAIVRCIPEEDP
jgi:hypothetical protein